MPEDAAHLGFRTVRVMIVDDTISIRKLLRTLLSRSSQIEVVGEAGDPYEARDMIRELNPDVVTLDVVMPRMDGLSFLEKIMRLRPMPVVMVSSRTKENSQEAIRALELGAVDCIDRANLSGDSAAVDALINTVLTAANSNVAQLGRQKPRAIATEQNDFAWNGKSVVIGSSTGGVDALYTVLSQFPKRCAPTVIAQHMPKDFLASFCSRLDKNCAAKVSLVEDGCELEPGRVFLAPGGEFHAALDPRDRRRVRLLRDQGDETYIPSVNVLFGSAVPHSRRMVGVMLTGMGRDGADAMLRMREAGAHTIVQDGASSVVDGMPRSAREIGAAIDVASLSEVGQRIIASTQKGEQDG